MLDDCLAATGTDAGAGWIVLAVSLVMIGIALTLLGRKLGFSAGLALVAGLIVALGVGPLVAGPSAATASECAPVTTAGTWQGDASVDGLDYSLVATIADDGVVASASVSYFDAGAAPLCTSTWSEVSRTGTTITFLETIDVPFDPFDCSDGGTITVTPTGDPLGSTLAWTYVYADLGLAAFAHGTTLFPVP